MQTSPTLENKWTQLIFEYSIQEKTKMVCWESLEENVICGMGTGPENSTFCWSFPPFFIIRSSLRANVHIYTNYKQKEAAWIFAVMLEKDPNSALNRLYKHCSNFFSFLECSFHKFMQQKDMNLTLTLFPKLFLGVFALGSSCSIL